MRRAKTLAVSLAALLALALAALTFGVSSASALPGPVTQDLIAGQNQVVGSVIATPLSSTSLKVEYQLNAGWCLTQTHVAAATSLAGIPHTKTGNPIPGQFPQGDTFSTCQTSAGPYTFTGLTTTPAYVAAHAVVWDKSSLTTTTVVSRPGVTVNGSGSAVAALEPGVGVSYPGCPAGDDDSIPSLWDSNAKLLGGATPNWGSADWIWTTPYPLTPVAGEVATFSDGFTLPAGFQLGGTLTITADNAYSATLNSTLLGHSISLGPGFPGTLMENAQVGSWGVASQGWQLVNQYPLTGLVAGANTLHVTAANEYMYPDDSYLNWDSGAQTYLGSISIDPDGATQCINPAGLIYNLTAGTYTHSETAWAAGTGFAGANWATYFTVPLS